MSTVDYEQDRRLFLAYQVLSDCIAFAENVPHRILAWDELTHLDSIIVDSFKSGPISEVLRNEFAADTTTSAAFTEMQALPDEAIQLAVAQSIDCLLYIAADLVFSQESTEEATLLGVPPSMPDPESVFGDRGQHLRSVWWRALLLVLVHIERKVWVCDMSAPHPFHSLSRMHDPWSLFVLIWTYRSAARMLESAEALTPLRALGMHELSVRPFPVPKVADGPIRSRLVGIVGPLFFTSSGSLANPNLNSDERTPRVVQSFRSFVEKCAEVLPGWGMQADLLPSEEDCIDALNLRIRYDERDIDSRVAVVMRYWEVLGPFLQDYRQSLVSLSRDDVERVGNIVSWYVRVLEPTLSNVDLGKLGEAGSTSYLSLSGLVRILQSSAESKANSKSPEELTFSFEGWPFAVAFEIVRKGSQRTTSDGFTKVNVRPREQVEQNLVYTEDLLKSGTRLFPFTDSLSSAVNRFRERQSAYWATRVLAINGLLQRSHTRALRISANGASLDEYEVGSHLLSGFGNRLCQHLQSIAQGHLCNIWWVDRSGDSTRLVHAASYSKSASLRASGRAQIEAFRQAMARVDEPFRADSPSLVYRTAYRNRVEYADPEKCVLGGFPQNHIPQSYLALPIRHGGRVVGVLEIEGLLPNQLSHRTEHAMRRALALVGNHMYQRMTMWSLWMLNDLITHRDIRVLKREGANPLKDVSSALNNIFLCEASHIWVGGEDNSNRFSLKGFSREQIFRNYLDKYGISPRFLLPSKNELPIKSPSSPFAMLAIEIASSADAAGGAFAKARFTKGRPKTEFWTQSRLGESKLGMDFVSDGPEYREDIFISAKLNEMMAFAIFDTLDAPVTSHARNERGLTAGEKQHDSTARLSKTRTMGVVTLHDFGDSNKDGYTSEWSSVVAFVQGYIAFLLSQARLNALPATMAQEILIHQAKMVLVEATERLEKATGQIADLTSGESRQFLRRWIQKFPASEAAWGSFIILPAEMSSLIHGMRRIQSSAIAATESFAELNRMPQRLRRLTDTVRNAGNYVLFPDALGEAEVITDLLGCLKNKLASYRPRIVTELGCHISLNLPRGSYMVSVQPSMIDRIFTNIFQNVSKYCLPHTFCEVTLQKGVLEVRNRARHHDDDTVERLLLPGERGRSSENYVSDGTGYGLFETKKAAELASIGFKFSIEPMPSTDGADTTALFSVMLDFRHMEVRE